MMISQPKKSLTIRVQFTDGSEKQPLEAEAGPDAPLTIQFDLKGFIDACVQEELDRQQYAKDTAEMLFKMKNTDTD